MIFVHDETVLDSWTIYYSKSKADLWHSTRVACWFSELSDTEDRSFGWNWTRIRRKRVGGRRCCALVISAQSDVFCAKGAMNNCAWKMRYLISKMPHYPFESPFVGVTPRENIAHSASKMSSRVVLQNIHFSFELTRWNEILIILSIYLIK